MPGRNSQGEAPRSLRAPRSRPRSRAAVGRFICHDFDCAITVVDFTGARTRTGKNLLCASPSAILWRGLNRCPTLQDKTASPTSTGCAASLASSCSKRTATIPGSAAPRANLVSSTGRNSAGRFRLRSSCFLPEFRSRSSPIELRRKGTSRQPKSLATTIRRGAEIFALGLLFRVQEFALGWPMVALDRSASRGHPQHDRPLDDADGRRVSR